MGHLNKAYDACVDAVLVLYDRMFVPHVSAFSHIDKNAIIEEGHRINSQFEALLETFSKTITKTQMADVYFEWGKHLKQEAWFHYRFVINDASAMQYVIDANQDAIKKMEKAYALYKTKSAREATAELLELYQSHAQVLIDEKLALNMSAKKDSDVSDDESDVSYTAKRSKTAHNYTQNTEAFFESCQADIKLGFAPVIGKMSSLTVDTTAPVVAASLPSFDSGRSLYQLKKSGLDGLPRKRGHFFDNASEKEKSAADSLNTTNSTVSSSFSP